MGIFRAFDMAGKMVAIPIPGNANGLIKMEVCAGALRRRGFEPHVRQQGGRQHWLEL